MVSSTRAANAKAMEPNLLSSGGTLSGSSFSVLSEDGAAKELEVAAAEPQDVPAKQHGWLAGLTFSHFSPLVSLGSQRPLEKTDLPALPLEVCVCMRAPVCLCVRAFVCGVCVRGEWWRACQRPLAEALGACSTPAIA